MKIALIRKKYSDFGGAERYVASLAVRLAAAGHEIHIFANEWQAAEKHSGQTAHEGLRIIVHRIPVVKGISFLESLSFALNARRVLKKQNFDIIHSFERTLYQDIYRAGDGCHKEWLMQRRSIDPWYKSIFNRINPLHIGLLWLESRIFRAGGCPIIISNSERGKSEIMRHYGTPSEKIFVLYNPVDRIRFEMQNHSDIRQRIRNKLGIPLDEPVFLFVGSGFKRKGLSAAIEAFGRMKLKSRLMVIGKGDTGIYRSIAKKTGRENEVHFMGHLSDVEQYYCSCDLFILPTIYEPFSNVCLEAIASGLPVVTSRVNGASEIIENGKNGYIIENPLDSVEIANKMQMALMIDRQTVREHNSKLINQLSWEKHVEKLLNIYRSFLENKNCL